MNPLAEKLRRLQTLYAEILKSSHEGEGMDETHALFVDKFSAGIAPYEGSFGDSRQSER
jgi:hypothetical protein